MLQQQVDDVVDLKNKVFSLTEDKKELEIKLERAKDGEGSQRQVEPSIDYPQDYKQLESDFQQAQELVDSQRQELQHMKYINSELQSDRGDQGDTASSKHHVMASKLAEIEIRTP